MVIEDLGYNQLFEDDRNRLGFGEFSVARVTAEVRGAYVVRSERGEYRAKVTGKHMFTAVSREDYPAVGDWVAIDEPEHGHAVIRGVLPRHSGIKRKFGDEDRGGEKTNIQIIATNIDVAFVVESVDRDYNLNRLERYCAIAQDGGVNPAIILNKVDLLSTEELAKKVAELTERFPKVSIITTSTVRSDGLDELKRSILPGKTYCFLGSSGVGKSSLVNELLGADVIKTGDISTYAERGKHTTTSRQMYVLPHGGIVIDNPGIREVGMDDVGATVDMLFDDIAAAALKCKYADCTHTHEPGCAVRAAVESGAVNEDEYTNYLTLKKESAHYALSTAEKRTKSRQFGKFLKTAKKQLKERGV